MAVIVKYPLEFFIQLQQAKINFGTEGVGQGSPHNFKAILMKPGFVFSEVNNTFANSGIVRLAAPVISGLVETTGTLGAGTYYYGVSAINSAGETLASTEDNVTIAATKGVQVSWGAIDGATGYRIYGRASASELFLKEVGAVTTWTDDGALTPLGALPTINDTGEEVDTGNGYTENDELFGSLTVSRNTIDKFTQIVFPAVTWPLVGLVESDGLIILDDNEASLADKPIVAYVDFGATKSEASSFVVPAQNLKLQRVI
jgi:hypothetical protein